METPIYDVDIEDVFKRADKFKPHNLSPEDMERMEEELYLDFTAFPSSLSSRPDRKSARTD